MYSLFTVGSKKNNIGTAMSIIYFPKFMIQIQKLYSSTQLIRIIEFVSHTKTRVKTHKVQTSHLTLEITKKVFD